MPAFSRFSRYFVELARLGSLHRAAAVLHVSASAIDRQILLAEEELNTALFERLPGGMKLTAAGELLLADLGRWRKDYDRTLERFDELRGLRRGRISIAAIDALSEGLIIETVKRIGDEYPQFTFELQIQDNRRVIELVTAAEVDFGLLLDPVEHGGLEVRAMVDVPLGLVVPPGHPLAGECRVRYSQLVGYRQIAPAAPLLVHEHTHALRAPHGVDDNPTISCNNIRMIRALIRNGAGVGILSLLDVATDVAQGQLVFIPLQGRKVRPLHIALCVAPRRELSRAVQLAMQRIAQAIEQFPKRVT
jgi:DNA-binding transcriptional LysR family regulator